ncbi:MAG: hypothetical protein ACJAS4_003010 [Bacteriovoracaceae bacterium]|jgi:hypothetical protein
MRLTIAAISILLSIPTFASEVCISITKVIEANESSRGNMGRILINGSSRVMLMPADPSSAELFKNLKVGDVVCSKAVFSALPYERYDYGTSQFFDAYRK